MSYNYNYNYGNSNQQTFAPQQVQPYGYNPYQGTENVKYHGSSGNLNYQVPQATAMGAPPQQGLTPTQKILAAVVGMVLLVGIVAAVFLREEALPEVNIGAEVRNNDDYVGVVFLNQPNQAQFDAFVNAATRWSEIIVDNRISPIGVQGNAPICGQGNPEVAFEANTGVDHLVIFAEVTEIDGERGILGQAGPCIFDDNGAFPVVGIMSFDVADLDRLQDDGSLEAVILHEMGHVLGIGTLWNFATQGQISTQGFLARDRLLQNPVFIGNTFNPNGDGENVGEVATLQYNNLGGPEDFVPVEDGLGTEFQNGRQNGRGSIDGHWDIDAVPGELMVFAINPANEVFPLSAVTIGGLQDLGYVVDLSKADNFAINTRRSDTPLRGHQEEDGWEYMYGDNLVMNWTENQQYTYSLDD